MKEKVLKKLNCICMLNIDDVFALDRYIEYDSDSASMFGKWEKSMHLYFDIPIEDIETISSLKGVLSLEDELNVYIETLTIEQFPQHVMKIKRICGVIKLKPLKVEIEKRDDFYKFHIWGEKKIDSKPEILISKIDIGEIAYVKETD